MQHKSIPAFKFSILFITGIITGAIFETDIRILISIQLSLIILLLILRKYYSNSVISFILITLLVISFGIFKYNIDFFYFEDNSIRNISYPGKNINVRLIGIINQIPEYDSSKIRIKLNSRKIISGSDTIIVSGDVIANIRKDIFAKPDTSVPDLRAGDEVILKGKLSDVPTKRNPGEFDYKKYLELQDIHKIFYVTGFKNVKVISRDNLNFFNSSVIFPAKIFALKNIDRYSIGDEAGLLKGLVTGERSNITEDMKDNFINAGVMHLIAVSGLNVAYIIFSLSLILSLLRVKNFLKVTIIMIFLVFYCFFTGNTNSIIRSSIMGMLVLWGFLLERKINFYNITGIAAMCILIYDTKQLFDPGFILSFTAVISMVMFLNVFQKLFLDKLQRKKIIAGFLLLFFTTFSAQVGILPVSVIYFGKISIISLLSNIIAVPLANISLALGFFQIIISILSEYFSSVIAEANNILLSSQLIFIEWCANLKFAYVSIPDLNFSEILCYYFILVIIFSFRKKYLFKLVICLLIIISVILFNFDVEKKLKITFLDVGQGDCTLIQTPDGRTILVDCGRLTQNFNSGERTIAPLLFRKGIHKIDLIILTHFHNDHIGGADYLLENFDVGKILISGQRISASPALKIDSLIIAKNIDCEIIRAGDYIDNFKDIRLYFLFPTNEFVYENGYTRDNNLNNGSIVFILKYKDYDFLFTGDIESEGEKYLVDTYSDFLNAEILKVAHHGSNTSTTVPFIEKNNPKYGIISCGLNNKFNHPSDLILDRLKKSGIIIYRTDIDAAVVVSSDGYKINFDDWK